MKCKYCRDWEFLSVSIYASIYSFRNGICALYCATDFILLKFWFTRFESIYSKKKFLPKIGKSNAIHFHFRNRHEFIILKFTNSSHLCRTAGTRAGWKCSEHKDSNRHSRNGRTEPTHRAYCACSWWHNSSG